MSIRKKTIHELLEVKHAERDKDWLLTSLQAAIELEHSTIPPYLCASWSVTDQSNQVASAIFGIAIQEMLHMTLACNLMNAVGGHPQINLPGFIPTYPGHLPGGCRPKLIVDLEGLSPIALQKFMSIEYPDDGPVAGGNDPAAEARVAEMAQQGGHTIGEFYDEIAKFLLAHKDVIIPNTVQLGKVFGTSSGWTKINSIDDAITAINTIKSQGEGTQGDPMSSTGGVVAHYYQFAQVYHGYTLMKSASGVWAYNGPAIPFPTVLPVAPIPREGYPDLTDCQMFDEQYTLLLLKLHEAWSAPDISSGETLLDQAVNNQMPGLTTTAQTIMSTKLPTGNGNYGPTFRFRLAGNKQGFIGLVLNARSSELEVVVNFNNQRGFGGTVGGVYSLDRWQTMSEFSQKHESSQGPYVFRIKLPSPTASIELAVYYDPLQGERVWDSKYGDNYQATIANGKVQPVNYSQPW